MDDINQELQSLSAERVRRGHLANLLEEAQAQLSEQGQRLKVLGGRLESEERDVAKLEGHSVRGLFLTLLSSKQEQLEKERQELLAAQLKYDECQQSYDQLKTEVLELSEQLELLGDVEQRYAEELQKKETLLLSSKESAAGRALQELAIEIGKTEGQLKELREAHSCGVDVASRLDQALDDLKSARNWGTWDLLGGGMLVTMGKHSAMDRANGNIRAAQGELHRFRRELADVNLSADLEASLSGFESFADYFFDGLIVDWIVQSRIQKSSEQVGRGLADVDALLDVLVEEIQAAEERFQEQTEARGRLIRDS